MSVSAAVEYGRVVSPATFPSSQRDTLQGGGRPGLTPSDKSFSHSQSHCLRGSPSPSIPLALLFMLLRVSGAHPRPSTTSTQCPPPTTTTTTYPPPHSPPLHFICILFLGPLISPLSFPVVPFLISLYLAPSSCSSSSETMLLRGCRGTPTKATMIIRFPKPHVNTRQSERAAELESVPF